MNKSLIDKALDAKEQIKGIHYSFARARLLSLCLNIVVKQVKQLQNIIIAMQR